MLDPVAENSIAPISDRQAEAGNVDNHEEA